MRSYIFLCPADSASSCETAIMLAEDYDGKVQVVNNQRISVTMKLSVYDAKKLADAGKSATEIKEILEAMKFESTIYIMVGYAGVSQKGWKDHTGCCGYWFFA